MTRTRPDAIAAFLALLAWAATGAGAACRRPQPDAVPASRAADAHHAVTDTSPDAESARPNVAAPETTPVNPPKRPAGVPAEAFWVGGPDGGVFVVIKRATRPPGTFAGKIYHDDGTLWYAGPLVPAPRGVSIDPSQHHQFDAWDGDNLLLSDGRWLESVKTKRRPQPSRRF